MANGCDMRKKIDARADAVRVAYFGEVGTKWEHIGEASREKWRQAVRNVVERETALRAELAHVLALNDALAKRAEVGELDEGVAYGWAYQALRSLEGSGAEVHRQQQALDAVASAVREAWAHRGRTTLDEFPYPMSPAVGIELPYDPRDPDGDCGAARNAMSHVPESYEIAKLLGYCAALVARRDAIAAWQNHREHVGADSDEYAALIEARSKANDAASEAMARIGDLAPEVVRTLQAERDALKSGIVGFVHGAMPRMPLSLTSAVHGLLALVKS